jgi:hypothetical protein
MNRSTPSNELKSEGGQMRTPKVSRRFLAAALCLAVVGCSAATSTPASSPTAPTPAQATDTQGPYRLVFELPQTDWHTTDSITGLATLSFLGAGGVDYVAWDDRPLYFSLEEIGGSRRVAGMILATSCAGHRLDAGQPISSPITKAGSYDMNGPDSDFYRSFFDDPLLHLSAGDWTITVVASFAEGPGCSDIPQMLKAAVLVHVTA